MERERLQKVMAAAGIGSRRECEEIILDARVRVNGQIVSALPVLVDPEHDEIEVDGRPLRGERKVYFLLHKPKGVHCTNYDPAGRVLACDLMRGVRERVFPVGRLDAEGTGLLLMTNDGELAERLTHPRYGVPRTYRAHIRKQIKQSDIDRLKEGVWLDDGKAHILDAKIVHAARDGSVLEITLREGKNREVRRVLARLGHHVRQLLRIKIGPLSLRGLAPGAFRPLTQAEIKSLHKYAERQSAPPSPVRPRKPVRPPGEGIKGDRRRRQINPRIRRPSRPRGSKPRES